MDIKNIGTPVPTSNSNPTTPNNPQKAPSPVSQLISALIVVAVIIGAFFFLKGDITKSEFNQIRSGMSYRKVCDIIGAPGELLAETEIGDFSGKSYSWKGTLNFITGANAIITFSNGEVDTKAQTGLIF